MHGLISILMLVSSPPEVEKSMARLITLRKGAYLCQGEAKSNSNVQFD